MGIVENKLRQKVGKHANLGVQNHLRVILTHQDLILTMDWKVILVIAEIQLQPQRRLFGVTPLMQAHLGNIVKLLVLRVILILYNV